MKVEDGLVVKAAGRVLSVPLEGLQGLSPDSILLFSLYPATHNRFKGSLMFSCVESETKEKLFFFMSTF